MNINPPDTYRTGDTWRYNERVGNKRSSDWRETNPIYVPNPVVSSPLSAEEYAALADAPEDPPLTEAQVDELARLDALKNKGAHEL